MLTFADKVIKNNKELDFKGILPQGIRIMNPFRNDSQIMQITEQFYRKFYNDSRMRHLILGINPGRFGAGVTGIPFTDTKRMEQYCGITIKDVRTHEPSSVFVHEVIEAYGGMKKFYSDFFIGAVCPLGFVRKKESKYLNYNYYDSKELIAAVYDFIVLNIRKLIKLGVYTEICYCLGTGKNYGFLMELNEKHNFFDKIIALEHPRFIMQYRAKRKNEFVKKYIKLFKSRGLSDY